MIHLPTPASPPSLRLHSPSHPPLWVRQTELPALRRRPEWPSPSICGAGAWLSPTSCGIASLYLVTCNHRPALFGAHHLFQISEITGPPLVAGWLKLPRGDPHGRRQPVYSPSRMWIIDVLRLGLHRPPIVSKLGLFQTEYLSL